MDITNKSSFNWYKSGLGKTPYISDEVEAILSVYTGLTIRKKQLFQAFIDNIGGLDGDMWNQTDYLFVFKFAGAFLENFKDLKGHANPFSTTVTDGQKIANYTSTDGYLTQLYNPGTINNTLGVADNWYKASIFGAIKKDTSLNYDNNIQLGYGALKKAGNSNTFTGEKYDGVSGANGRQTAILGGNSAKAVHTFALSGLTGKDEANQNVLIVDGNQALLPIKSASVLTGSPNIARLGFNTNSGSPNVRMRDAAMLGFGRGYTREQVVILEQATNKFITAINSLTP